MKARNAARNSATRLTSSAGSRASTRAILRPHAPRATRPRRPDEQPRGRSLGNGGRARRQAGPRAPDRAEVVDPDERLDPLRIEVEEAAAAGDARVVDEQVDRRVSRTHGGRYALDVLPIGDVAPFRLDLELGAHRR